MNKYSFHDVPAGPLKRCQITDRDDLEFVIDLGHQPLCDSLLTTDQLDQPEQTFPLRLYRSKGLGHAQLDYVAAGDLVYHNEYPYRCGITKEVVEHHEALAAHTIQKHRLAPGSLVVDVGSNDGTLLRGFQKHGMRVLGVEPTSVADIARADGVDTLQDFFTESLAREIAEEHGKASLVISTNAFAHMATLGEVIRGIASLLAEDGLFVFENHYIVNILSDGQFDTVYHEHIRSYSLASVVHLFGMYDFAVVDAEVVDRYGGSIRVTVARAPGQATGPQVQAILAKEVAFGLFENTVWDDFAQQARKAKNDLLEVALHATAQGHRLVGNSCPGRASTLLNFCGIGPDLMPYIAEQPTSLKLGLHLPGSHIPIVDNEVLFREQPDYVVLLAWHYWEPIMRNLRERGLRSKFVVPLPTLTIID